MANSAINQTPSIFLQGGQLFQNANSKIFDAISGAADMYEKMQMQKEANLNQARMKQAELAQSPDAAQPILAKALQFGAESLKPQERSTFDAIQQIQGAKVAIQPVTGQSYNPYQAISLPGAKPASPVAAAMLPQPAHTVTSDILPPPRVDGQAGSAEQFKKDMAPAPLGAPKVETPDDTGMSATPVGKMEKFKSNLDGDREIRVNNAKTQAEQQKAEFYKPKLQSILDQMADINQQLQDAHAMKSKDNGTVGNVRSMAAGLDIPIPFSGKSIPVGRATEQLLDKKIASLRDQYDKLKSPALALYKNAANIAAGSINSEGEQKLVLDAFGDSNGNYEANKRALETTGASYGTKKAEAAAGVDENDPKVKKALAAGYTLAEIKAHLSGRK